VEVKKSAKNVSSSIDVGPDELLIILEALRHHPAYLRATKRSSAEVEKLIVRLAKG
jgi:hypothetical protein